MKNKKKSPLSAVAALMGRKGGHATTPRKRRASARNAEKARAAKAKKGGRDVR